MRAIGWAAIALATAGVCMPRYVFANEISQLPLVADVRLAEGGVLLGQVVGTSGIPAIGTPVSLRAGQQEIGLATTDVNGYFAFSGVRGGVYQLVTNDGHGTLRAWAPGTAPPTAEHGALLVAGEDTIRSQWKCCLVNPWFLAGVAAAAIAIPVAIHNRDKDGGGTPVTPSQ